MFGRKRTPINKNLSLNDVHLTLCASPCSQLFSGENFKFGNPVSEAWRKLNGETQATSVSPKCQSARRHCNKTNLGLTGFPNASSRVGMETNEGCYRYVVTCESREIKLNLVARPNRPFPL